MRVKWDGDPVVLSRPPLLVVMEIKVDDLVRTGAGREREGEVEKRERERERERRLFAASGGRRKEGRSDWKCTVHDICR